MIKWVHLTALAKSPGDFRALVRLLEALGLRKGPGGQNDQSISQEFLPSDARLHLVHRKKPWNDSDLMIAVSDPDSAAEIAKSLGLEITNDSSGPEPEHFVRNFQLNLAGGTKVHIVGFRAVESTETEHIGMEGGLQGAGKRFGIVVSRFNSFITERLLNGALDGLHRLGVNVHGGYNVVRVPGAFEIPSASRTLAETGKYDAVICLGCLLRGDTAHYDVIANEVTRGIGQSAQETGVPHAFGVLTCDTLEQAIDRAGLKSGNKGFEAALSAVEMANLRKALRRQPSVIGKQPLANQGSAVNQKQVPRSARNDKLERGGSSRSRKTRKRPPR